MRIVSLNMCIDSILVELVPHERIIALSQYSRDPERSTISAIAQHLPITYETAEEVVALKPDLVLTSRHSAPATRNALRRVGIRFELFDVPYSIEGSLDQVRKVAHLLRREREGAALIARIESAIAAARLPAGQEPLTAAVYQPGGMSAGADTVTGELMQLVGLQNVAARQRISRHHPLSLEALLATRPDVLLVDRVAADGATFAERIVQHRALRALEPRMVRQPYPPRLLYCAGPTMIDSAAALVAAREHTRAALLSRNAL